MSESENTENKFVVVRRGGVEERVVKPINETKENDVPEQPIFQDILSRRRVLSRKESNQGLTTAEREEMQEVEAQMKEVIDEVDQQGGLDDLRDDFTSYQTTATELAQLSANNKLSTDRRLDFLSELRSARQTARQISLFEPRGERHTGVREYWMTQQIGQLNQRVGEFEAVDIIAISEAQDTTQAQAEQLELAREQIDLLRQQAEASTRAADQARLQTKILEQQRKEQSDYYALAQAGEEGVVYAEEQRARLNPEQFDQSPPLWWRKKSREEQGMIRARLHINYMAAVKRDSGMTNLEGVVGIQGLRIEREHLVNMWNDMPGFRIAMATMIGDFFDVDSGLNHMEITDHGYDFLENADEFDQYKERLIQRLENHFDEHEDELPDGVTLTNEQLAIAAVSTVDNLFFASGVYESGDTDRKLKNTKVWSEQIRALFMPGVKGKVKWVKGEIDDLPEGTEEGWGGPLGEWIRDRASNDPQFRRKLARGEMRLIPDRLFFSMLDHTQLNDSDEPTLGAALVNTPQVDIGNGLYDFREGADSINLRDIRADDLYGGYADMRDSAYKLYLHLTGSDPKAKLPIPKLVVALNKLRGDPILSNIEVAPDTDLLHDEDLLLACIIANVSPNGPIKGVSKIVLQPTLGDAAYDETVTQALADERIYVGMPAGTRDRLFDRLNANDTSKLGGALKSMFLADNFVGKRDRLRKQASRNRRID